MDLPTDKILYILPAVIFVLFGFAVGSAAHIRLFLPMTLSIPNERNLKKTSEPSSAINWSLGITGLFIFALPILISFLFLFQQPFKSLIPDYFSDWLWKIGGISIFMVIFYIAIVVYRFSHKISKRRLWDCGSNYAGSELSIASSVISDPLHSSIGTYFNDRSGEPFLDVKIISNLVKSLDFGRLWIDKVESGDLSNYIAFTSLSLLASVIFILSGFLV
jgi:hypothetical protein